MFKLIIFDLSGVVGNAEEDIYLERFASKHKINLAKLQEIYYRFLFESEKGNVPLQLVWDEVLKRFDLKEDYIKIIKEVMGLKTFDKEVLQYLMKLHKKIKLAYLTNYAEDYWNIHRSMINLEYYFNFGIVSYQVGARKPDEKGFRLIMKHFLVKPEETIFIDDSPKNVAAAGKLGIKAIQFRGLESLKNDIDPLF